MVAAADLAAVDLPDAPGPATPQAESSAAKSQKAQAPDQTAGQNGGQTKRILGIVPNFRSVSADVHLPPESPKEKIVSAIQDSFDYSAFVFVGAQAALYYGNNSTPQFGDGFVGYGRYYWHTFVDNADENVWVQALVPVALHQDSRFYTLGHGSKLKRAGYAMSRVLITRNDAGNRAINYSEIGGAAIASGISTLYYPSVDRNASKAGQLWYTNVLIDGGTFVFKEFWPDINSSLFHQKN